MSQDELHTFIDELELHLIKLNAAISDTYFLADIAAAPILPKPVDA